MKRYLSGILAVTVAISTVAFTTKGKIFKPYVSYVFHYTGGSYLKTPVETNGNWAPGSGSGCGSTQNKACQMQVLSTYTHDDGTGTQVLNTSGNVLSITAVKGANNTDFVPSASTAISGINNKP